MQVIFSPQAQSELDDAVDYYDLQQAELGAQFLDVVERAATRIGRTPMQWPVTQNDVRRCLLRRFPYSLFYSVETDHVYVIALAHQHRRPGYWVGRISGQ